MRSNRKRHCPEEVDAKLRQADEALAKGTPIAEVARTHGDLSQASPMPSPSESSWSGLATSGQLSV